jgi:hypothetical protein
LSNRELRLAREDIGNRLMHDLLTPEGRIALEQRLRDVKAVLDQRDEITELLRGGGTHE